MKGYSNAHIDYAVARLIDRFKKHTFSNGAIEAGLDKFRDELEDAFYELGFADGVAEKMADDARTKAAKQILFIT